MLSTRSSHLILWLLVGAGCLFAQQAQLTGPVSGYVFDSAAGGIRPIVGLPGASYLGEAVVAGLEWAAAAPDGKLALARRDGALYAVRGLETADPAWAAIDGSIQPERVAWGAGGSAAVASGNRVQLLRNLATAPTANAAVELPATVTALVMALDGAIAGVDGGLYLVAPGQEPRLLAALEQPVALALGPGGRDLFVADAASGQVFQAPDFRQGANLLAIGGELSDPVALLVSGDGRLFVAGKGSKALGVYDLASRTLASRMELDFEPACLDALSADSLFLLKPAGRSGDPLRVLTAGPSPAIYFVPAGRGE